jgi:MFS family permease
MATEASSVTVAGAPARARFYGWRLLFVLWLIMAFNLGFPAYGTFTINAVMSKSLGLSRETLSWVFSAYMVMSGLPGPLVAICINRLGSRRTLMIGSGLLIVGAVLMATCVHAWWQAALVFGLLVGTGVATGAALASQSVLGRWFVRRRSMALSILYSAGAIGGFVASPLIAKVIRSADGDWRAGWWVIAGLSLVAGLLAMRFVRERPSDLGQATDGDPTTSDAKSTTLVSQGVKHRARPAFISTDEWTYREALSTPAYWLIVMSLVGGSGGYSLFLAQGGRHLMDLGHSLVFVSWSISIVTITGLLAKAVVATLGDRIDPRYLWAVFTAFFGVGLVLVVDARTPALVFAFATCLGIGFGGGVVCLMAVLNNYFGTSVFASLSGLAIAINTTLSVIAAFVGGRLYDQGHGYDATFYTTAIWCFVGAVVLFVLRPPRKSPQK